MGWMYQEWWLLLPTMPSTSGGTSRQTTCLSVCLSVCLCVAVSVCLSICVSVRLSVCLLAPSVYLCLPTCVRACWVYQEWWLLPPTMRSTSAREHAARGAARR